jgi:hypothetical protein
MSAATATVMCNGQPILGRRFETVSDSMIGPGSHENAAMNAITEGRIEEGQAIAILALASAVNRLAAAQEAIANT